MNLYKKHSLLGLALLLPFLFLAQSAKKCTAEGESLEKEGKYMDAVKAYSNALNLDTLFYKAYAGRARCSAKLNKQQEAISDFKKAVQIINPDDKINSRYGYAGYIERDMRQEKKIFYDAGKFFMEQNLLSDADVALRKALDIDRVYIDAIDAEVKVLVKMRDFTNALTITQLGIDSKQNAMNYYRHATIHDSLSNYEQAEKYYKYALEQDSKYLPAHVALALVQVKLTKYDAALKHCEIVLGKEPENAEALFARSLVNAATKNLQNALNDITKAILAKPSEKAYLQRAEFYEAIGQYHNAATDYSSIIKENSNAYGTYYKRALCYEQMQDVKLANEDYNTLLTLTKNDTALKRLNATIVQKKHELNRESKKPEIELYNTQNNTAIRIPAKQNIAELKGKVKDASNIKSIIVNAQEALFVADSLNPEFSIKLYGMTTVEEITITATDVYNNAQTVIYKINRTENDKPVIVIETPYTSPENGMSIDTNGPELYIQGKVQDSSLIASIVIDGINASYNADYLNPIFSSQIKIADKQSIKIVVKDIYGNEAEQNFNLDRSSLLASIDNPMGNTWIVFIENSQYTNFASLEGPAKDVMALKAALVNYKVTRMVHKQNMTKTELEKFFSLELRDYVKNNNITSLLVWYAGHGKYVNPTGYWVPTDARPDDEFSYYGINNLKAAMQSYSERLVHTLVVTDACESGPTFLVAARGNENEEKSCKDTELTKSKSSQIFTSAGFELASDNSQFTKNFVSCLNNNVEECLPINKIVKKVSYAVSQSGNQAPKFGKIKDLEDNGGTFFFIKK